MSIPIKVFCQTIYALLVEQTVNLKEITIKSEETRILYMYFWYATNKEFSAIVNSWAFICNGY